VLDLEQINKTIEEMGGIEKLIPLMPLSIIEMEKYYKAKVLDQIIPLLYWRTKAGLTGNGVTTFYCSRTNPPFPLKMNIDEKVQILKRAAVLLIEQYQNKRKH